MTVSPDALTDEARETRYRWSAGLPQHDRAHDDDALTAKCSHCTWTASGRAEAVLERARAHRREHGFEHDKYRRPLRVKVTDREGREPVTKPRQGAAGGVKPRRAPLADRIRAALVEHGPLSAAELSAHLGGGRIPTSSVLERAGAHVVSKRDIPGKNGPKIKVWGLPDV